MSPDQRRKFFAILGDLSRQLKWPVNGEPTLLHKDDWKMIVTAALMKENRIAAGLDGGHVVLGLRLRDIFAGLSDDDARRRASDLIELVTAFALNNGVELSDPEEAAMRAAYEREQA